MIRNKKAEQDLKEIGIRIHDLKVNRTFDFKKGAVSILSVSMLGAIAVNKNLNFDTEILTIVGCLFGLNVSYNAITIAKSVTNTNEQIRNLKYLKNLLENYDLTKISIDEINNKLALTNEKDKNKSNLEFLKHYLTNNSLSHDDMTFKKAAVKTRK